MVRYVDADSAERTVMSPERHVQVTSVTLLPRASRAVKVGRRLVAVARRRHRRHRRKPVHVAREGALGRLHDGSVSVELDPKVQGKSSCKLKF